MNELTREEMYWVWLSSIDGVFAKWFYILQSFYLEPKAVWESANDILADIPNFPAKIADAVKKARNDEFFENLFLNIRKKELSVVAVVSDGYPYTLKSLFDPPPVLYYKGVLPEMWERSVSIVGTRRPSRNGVKIARDIAEEIVLQDVLVVSGMARGIDTAAHTGAMNGGGKTVAVLGCGADIVYPKENGELYEKIIQNGAILSEFRPGTPPIAENFPQRNRIIAAISNATIVSEGGEKSGARITADIALSLGRQVFAIPCEPKSDVCALPIFLLKSGAAVLSCGADLMDTMNWKTATKKNKKENNKNFGLDFFQEQIYNSLLKGDMTVEQIANRMDVQVSRVSSALTVMEILGAVESLPGNVYSIK